MDLVAIRDAVCGLLTGITLEVEGANYDVAVLSGIPATIPGTLLPCICVGWERLNFDLVPRADTFRMYMRVRLLVEGGDAGAIEDSLLNLLGQVLERLRAQGAKNNELWHNSGFEPARAAENIMREEEAGKIVKAADVIFWTEFGETR